MKITKSYLKKVIMEELEDITDSETRPPVYNSTVVNDIDFDININGKSYGNKIIRFRQVPDFYLGEQETPEYFSEITEENLLDFIKRDHKDDDRHWMFWKEVPTGRYLIDLCDSQGKFIKNQAVAFNGPKFLKYLEGYGIPFTDVFNAVSKKAKDVRGQK